MDIEWTDFNGAGELLSEKYADEWLELHSVLTAMPLHLKASDQKGKVGTHIFNPVGTNQYIKHHLSKQGWKTNIPVPAELRFLGIDVDLTRDGVVLEVQFSNYPFLLNNVIRSELFFRTGAAFTSGKLEMLIVVTKAGRFPASNSTLYYEQAITQLAGLDNHKIFDVPVRVVGLFSEVNSVVPCVYGKYSAKRYSRTIETEEQKRCQVLDGHTTNGKWRLNVLE
ncbi:BglII/BstYI family type II restriction endonuclease [Planctomycetes bacterium TBK1r]|uniref:Type-2 restriction enzyme BglII n=1 Tax=Stieleria magnilauensis TaxID=2527963 RepID=A0ABX5XRE7_9BACT|nr:Type-2 restriction enzyme BglII [Planctomycetes bacterium TBK1r]